MGAPASSPSLRASALWGFFLVALGCISNNYFLELIVSRKKNPHADPAAGGLLTLLQFALVSVASAPYGLAWRGFGGSGGLLRGLLPLALRPLTVPLRHYAGMTALFFSMSVLNNAAYNFNISQPMHMVFRSSSLMVTYVMGRAFFKKQYTRQELLAVVLLTCGALSATAAEALLGDTAAAAAASSRAGAAGALPYPSPCAGGACSGDAASAAALAARALALLGMAREGEQAEGTAYMLRWALGMLILVSVLVLQTFLGNYQNWTARTYGRAPHEGMFWCHTLPLPAFLLTARGLAARGALWAASPALRLAAGGSGGPLLQGLLATPLGGVPVMWALVIANAVSQYVCVRGVGGWVGGWGWGAASTPPAASEGGGPLEGICERVCVTWRSASV